MVDFRSALYLGFQHSDQSLRPWSQLTTGAPAALVSLPGSDKVADQIACLQGCERGTLGTSTLHLFWDLFGVLAQRRIVIYLDSRSYPIARWGVERAAALGAVVRSFPHRNVRALEQLLREGPRDLIPVVVADGMCSACGCVMPMSDYLNSVRRSGGLLVIDDTQALGILGSGPDGCMPYGYGGGGSLRYSGIGGPDLLIISSLAKSFGVPLAVLSGSQEMVGQFEARSQTRIHCSPPSAADIHAAEHALKVNAAQGDSLREQLSRRVRQFRQLLARIGLAAAGGLFPIQTLKLPASLDSRRIHQKLLDLGVQTVLRKGHGGNAQISFIITARHLSQDIERSVDSIAAAVLALTGASNFRLST